jgi:hypothetical protein
MPPNNIGAQAERLAIFVAFWTKVIMSAAIRVRPHRLEDIGAPVYEKPPVILDAGSTGSMPLHFPPFRCLVLILYNPDRKTVQTDGAMEDSGARWAFVAFPKLQLLESLSALSDIPPPRAITANFEFPQSARTGFQLTCSFRMHSFRSSQGRCANPLSR